MFPDSCPAITEGIPWFPPDERAAAFELECQIIDELRGAPLVNMPYRDNFTLPELFKPWVCTLYKHGAKVFPKLSSKKAKSGRATKERGQIKGMSPKARRRAAFDFGNAPFGWAWMATLTYQFQPANPGADFKKFLRKLRARWDCACQWGWLMEYQVRHVIHYHLFFGSDFIARNCPPGTYRVASGRGHREGVPVIRGDFDDWFVREWVSTVEDATEAFVEFQTRGIIEPFRSPDAAARYVAKETGKSHQKALPEGIDGGRRWWWLSPEGQPVPEGTAKLVSWPLDRVTSLVFDKTTLAGSWDSDPTRDDSPYAWSVDMQAIEG